MTTTTAIIVLISITLFISIVNLVFLVAIGAFVVRFKDYYKATFSDLIDSIESLSGQEIVPVSRDSKTWDQKYEEDLEKIARKTREISGLTDLPDPTVSWGVPPAANPENTKGLTIKDK